MKKGLWFPAPGRFFALMLLAALYQPAHISKIQDMPVSPVSPQRLTPAVEAIPDTHGQLVITEVMANPGAVIDTLGEYFEIYNPSSTFTYQLQGCVISDEGVDSHQISGIVSLPPGSYSVFARSASAFSGTPSYIYSNFILDNTSDEVILTCYGFLIDQVRYTAGMVYDGRSMNLPTSHTSAIFNDFGSNWCASALQFSTGDYGTPGAQNSNCYGSAEDFGLAVVIPNHGLEEGGETVSLLGVGFTGASGVKWDSAPLSTWSLVSDTQINLVVPAHPAGDVDVTVESGVQSATLTGGFRYTGKAVTNITWADLHSPQNLTGESGVPTAPIYGQVFAAGLTELPGPPPILAQIGYGPCGSDPRSHPGWHWVNAAWERQDYNNDEFKSSLLLSQSGAFLYGARFSADGGYNFIYGDFNPGTTDGFEIDDLGKINGCTLHTASQYLPVVLR